ncbi:cAMP-dependent protein kinase type II regulatory subunit-like isoform X3 [Apostichopus japonicus]|uniref:cAMP-dependent protein kinase type II regulatory subunit-like isoform X3 n=1 Tax=Stichopus japonicus TaxID=307972 RepID=UPI003AB2FCFC
MTTLFSNDITPEESQFLVLPGNKYGRRKSVCAERYDPDEDDNDNEPKVVYPKSDDQRDRLAKAVKPILLFRALDETQMQDVLDAMFEKKTSRGEHIIDEGDDGDNFYVIDSGTFDILKDINGEVKKVGMYDNTGSFGELALMYNTPRAATIVASSDNGIIWALGRDSFRRIVLKNAARKRRVYENLLESVSMLKSLEPYERMNLADALVTKPYSDGQCIISQGDDADGCYFVEEGTVRVSMKNTQCLCHPRSLFRTLLDYLGYFLLTTAILYASLISLQNPSIFASLLPSPYACQLYRLSVALPFFISFLLLLLPLLSLVSPSFILLSLFLCLSLSLLSKLEFYFSYD